MKRRRFIGITGGIGSGKSRVSRALSACAGIPLMDIDLLCRELLAIGMPGWQALQANLDRSFFHIDGELDREGLRTAIFNDSRLRHRVNRLIHPLALDLLLQRGGDMTGPLIVDVPLLFEAGWEGEFSHTVVVYADRETCCRRVSGRDSLPLEEAAKAVSAQMEIGEKAMRADHVIDNRYCWLLTRIQVTHLAGLIRSCSRCEDE